MPVRITLLRHPHRNHDTETETTNAPGTVEPENIDSSGNIFSETSGSSSEDEIDSDTCIHKRSSGKYDWFFNYDSKVQVTMSTTIKTNRVTCQ